MRWYWGWSTLRRRRYAGGRGLRHQAGYRSLGMSYWLQAVTIHARWAGAAALGG